MAVVVNPRTQPILAADQPIPPPPPLPSDVNIAQTLIDLQNAGVPPLETETYNLDKIELVIANNLYSQDVINPANGAIIHHQGAIRSTGQLETDLKKIFEKGLRIALPREDPGQEARRAINTMTVAVHRMDLNGDLHNPLAVAQVYTDAINSEIGANSLANLHYEQIVPLAQITNMFVANGREILERKNITVADMERVSREFRVIMQDIQAQGVAAGLNQRDTSNLLRELSRWTDDNVANDQLRQILKNDAKRVSGQRLSQLGLRASNLVPEIVPLTLSRGVAIESAEQRNFVSIIENAVAIHVDAQAGDRQAARNLIQIVQHVNDQAKNHRMRFQGPAVNGVTPPAKLIHVNLRHTNNTPKSVNEIKADLQHILDNFKNPRSTFFRQPTKEIELRGVSENVFIQDLQRATASISKGARKSRVKDSTMPRPHRIKKIGAILIRGDASNRKEIHIKPHAKKEDLLKLVYLLTAENGTLDDAHHNMLLQIRKGQDATPVYAKLMEQLGKNLGGPFYLVWTPDSPVGGHFLDGFMDVLNSKPFISNQPSMNGGSLGLGSMTSSGYMHVNPQQAFLNLPLSAFTPFKPMLLGHASQVIQPIRRIAESVSDVSRIVDNISHMPLAVN